MCSGNFSSKHRLDLQDNKTSRRKAENNTIQEEETETKQRSRASNKDIKQYRLL